MLQDALPRPDAHPRPALVPVASAPAPSTLNFAKLLAYGLSIAFGLGYAVFFAWLSLQRYDAFLPHALDLGNMDQAVWNTLHGHLFRFTNMRVDLPKEAWGTTTRLSFHVEPILLPLALLYLIHAGPETLLIAQAVIVALGAPAAARLALRVTGHTLAAVAAAAAYLLAPALQAATLYEFHPVTLAAPALLWAMVFLEERRLRAYAVCAVLAICCKEEIGLIVAVMGLWHWRRGGDRRVALASVVGGVGWSALALLAIIPHFAHGASAYWQRYINAGVETGRTSGGARALLTYWIGHPTEPLLQFLWAPKWTMLHRLLVSTGYLSLAGLPTLMISLPSLAIIMLSTDQHMYGGLGHYSAELVPIVVAAAIYGLAWLARQGERLRIPARLSLAVGALWLLGLALANERVNGFSPLATGYAAPVITAHDRLGQRLLALVPPRVPVSAMDQLDPHLGDRLNTYLFPDVGDAQYVALDVTTNVNPGTPASQQQAAMALLDSRHWEILAADDGYLILHRVARPLLAVPRIPRAFYSFMLPEPATPPQPVATFSDGLQLLDVQLERREQVSLRIPDVIVITTWRATRPLPGGTIIQELVTNPRGQVVNHYDERPATAWLPVWDWRPGQIVRVQSRQISLVDIDPGAVSIRVRAVWKGQGGQLRDFPPRLMGHEQRGQFSVVGDAVQLARIRLVF